MTSSTALKLGMGEVEQESYRLNVICEANELALVDGAQALINFKE